MNVLIVGLNHKTAAVEVREKLAFEGEKLAQGLSGLRELPAVEEAVILSTCNRVELYTGVRDAKKASEQITSFISEFHDLQPRLLDEALYFLSDKDAVRHSFRVASSLDSMVVGEPQILGQLKDAFEYSLEHKASGVLLNKLMKKSISVAKRVRTETKIAENAVSISFAAVELAKKIFTDIKEHSVLLLGAGEMAELAAKHLVNSGVKELLVANRTHSRGEELAKEMGGRPVKYETFLNEMQHTDIVICSTGASEYVLTKKQMHDVMKDRKQRQAFIIDITVPRNIDPAINDMANVFLYHVDDLQDVVKTNVMERQKEAEKAGVIVDEEVETFRRWQASLDSVPTIVALREKAEEVKLEEIEKILRKSPELGEAERDALSRLATGIVNKLIHPPTAALKEDAEDKDVLIALINRLYGIDKDDA